MPALTGRFDPFRLRPLLASLAVGIAGAAALAMLVRLLLTLASPAQLPVPTEPALAGAGDPERITLADWHLFGASDDTLQALPLASQLRGVAATADPTQGLAFVVDADGQDGRYRAGDSLPGGSLLVGVHADGIEILHQGQRRRLMLSDAAVAPAADGAAPPAVLPAAAAAAPEVSPVVRDGRLLGLNVAFADADLLERLGLRPDDLITTVDGRAANSPGVADTLGRRLAQGEPLRLGVRRGGSDLALDLGAGNR